nr:unnamed protein product [uncultured bacterium]
MLPEVQLYLYSPPFKFWDEKLRPCYCIQNQHIFHKMTFKKFVNLHKKRANLEGFALFRVLYTGFNYLICFNPCLPGFKYLLFSDIKLDFNHFSPPFDGLEADINV